MKDEEKKKEIAETLAKMMKSKISISECVAAIKTLTNATEKAASAFTIFSTILNRPAIKLAREIDDFYREACRKQLVDASTDCSRGPYLR